MFAASLRACISRQSNWRLSVSNHRAGRRPSCPKFLLVVDPSYDDLTSIAVIDADLKSRPYCYLSKRWKAWDFSFATLREIADFVLSVAEELAATATLRLKAAEDQA